VDPKQEALKQIIQETKRGIKIIVFTQYRDTAREIVKNINEIEGVRAVRFVGQMTKEGDAGLSQKEQLKILDGFIGGEFNVLVATQVAEEGLDIPSVDLVVFYEPVPSEIRAIQRRGRTGRKRAGKVVVLMTKDTRDEGIYWSSAFKERRMKKSLRQIKDSSEEKGNVRISRWIE
jgi:Fanconi anemia group M protein